MGGRGFRNDRGGFGWRRVRVRGRDCDHDREGKKKRRQRNDDSRDRTSLLAMVTELTCVPCTYAEGVDV